MAYPDPDDIKEVQQRYHTYADTGKPAFKETTLRMLDRDLGYLLRDMGITVGEDRKVPETNGVPRIFVMTPDAEGFEKPMSLEEAGLDLSTNNAKFWEQVSMGNVFAYPAGADHPVQLQADAEQYGGDLSYTDQMASEALPARQVPRPGFFARIMHAISGGRLYKAEFNAYNSQNDFVKNEELKLKLRNMEAARELHKDDEITIAQEVKAEADRKAHQEQLDLKLSEVKLQAEAASNGYKILHSVYKPVPEKHEYLRKDVAHHKAGLYTDEHFADLKVYSKDELDLSRITLAPKGKIGPSVSEKDFCAVAMFAGMKPEVAENSRFFKPEMPAIDVHAVSCMQNILGLTEAQAKQIMADDHNGMYTTDLFIVPRSRDNNGSYFKKGTNAARQMAADAFNAYKQGDKEPLAKLLAYGIERTCNQMVSLGGVPGNEAKGCLYMGLHLTTILNKDPELKQLAFQNGMTDKQLKSVEAMSEYQKLDTERNQAKLKLAEAAAKHTELSPEEKTSCMKAILKGNLVDVIWLSEAKAQNDKTREIEKKMTENLVMAEAEDFDEWKLHPEKRPAPEEGKFWMDTGAGKYTYVQRLYRPIPPVIGSLKDQTSLDEITDRIILEDAPAKKSCEDLLDLYSDKTRLEARSVQVAETIKNEKLLGPDENLNIDQAEKEAENKAPADDYDIDIDKTLNIGKEIEKMKGPHI